MNEPRPGPQDPDDIDRRFREIVEGLRGTGSGVDAPPDDRATGVPPPPPVDAGAPERMATDHRSYQPAEDPEDDHFVPPPPPPLPAGDLHFWGVVVGLVLGPLLVTLSAVIPVLDRVWTTVGVVITLAGFVLLVLRLPRHRRDGDWGARV